MGFGRKAGTDIGDVVRETKKSIQQKIRKIVCCAVIWLILAILFLVMGCVLLGYFASYWNEHETETAKAAAAYIGVASLGIGAIMVVVAIVLFVVFNNIIQINRRKKAWVAPVFPHGEAPYPQQKLPQTNAPVSTIEVAPPQAENYSDTVQPVDHMHPPPMADSIPPPPPLPQISNQADFA